MILRCRCTLAPNFLMEVWLNNSKKICLGSIGKMLSLIRANTKNNHWKKMDRQRVLCSAQCWCCTPRCEMYCNIRQFPWLPFFGPHSKPHGARGSIEYYHLRFDPKLGNGVCAIHRIPRAWVACKSMLYKSWISGTP